MKQVSTFLCTLLLLSATFVFSQGQSGKAGVGVSLVNTGIRYFGAFNADIIVPYWINQRFMIQPRFGITQQDKPSQIRIGADFYSHFRDGEKVSPYVTFGALLFFDNKYLAGKSQSDFLFNLGLGGEYFWDEKASIGGDTGFLLTKNGASGMKAFIGTYAQAILRWYLK